MARRIKLVWFNHIPAELDQTIVEVADDYESSDPEAITQHLIAWSNRMGMILSDGDSITVTELDDE